MKNEKSFQIFFDNAPIALAQFTEDLRLKAVNAAYCKFIGYSEVELKNMSILDITHPEDKQRTIESFKNKESNGELLLNRHEKRYIHKSGKTIWGSVTARAVKLEESEAYSIFSSIEDITEKKENEEKISITFETMADGLVVQDSNGAITQFNSSALSILGLTSDQLLGRSSMDPNWSSIKLDGSPFPGSEHPAMVALRTGKKITGELMGLKLPSGEERWIRINATPYNIKNTSMQYSNEMKQNAYVICTFTDVTALIVSKKENQFILDSLQIGVWRYNPNDQSLFWDKSMYQVFDINEENFKGHYEAWESTLTPESKSKAVEELEQAIRGEKEFDTIFEIMTSSRGKRLISAKAKVVRDSNGAPLMMYGINMDVTDKRLEEIERERTSKFLEVVLQNVPSMIFVKDYKNNMKFSLLNKAGQNIIGLSEEQLLGKNDYDFFPKAQADFFAAKDKQVFESKTVLKIDKEEIDTATGKRYLRTSKVPTFDSNGNPQFLIGISSDITDELNIKEALEREQLRSIHNAKLASLGEVSAGVAHEINNPLGIIAGTIPLLHKFKNDEVKFQEKTEALTKAAIRIERIVRGLKKFSRSAEVSVYRMELISTIIEESLVITEAKSRRHHTPIKVEINGDLQIFCDSVEIEQVFVNIINNGIDAVKNHEERWVQIKAFKNNDQIIVQIVDSGSGISGEVEQKIFQPFFTTKAVNEGTGLGLSITKGILDQHKATISLNRTFLNTCFEIRFSNIAVEKIAA